MYRKECCVKSECVVISGLRFFWQNLSFRLLWRNAAVVRLLRIRHSPVRAARHSLKKWLFRQPAQSRIHAPIAPRWHIPVSALPVAPKNASRPNRLVHVSACRRTIHRILSNIGKTGFIRKEKTQPCNYNILIWQDCFLYMLCLKEGKDICFPSNFKKERR